MLSYTKKDNRFSVDCGDSQTRVRFDINLKGWELEEDEEQDYKVLWQEVRDSLMNGRSTGSTYFLFFNSDGTYDIKFQYYPGCVDISSSTMGGGIDISLPLLKDQWLPLIADILKCY